MFANISLKVIINTNRTNAHRSTGKDQIANLKRKKLAYVSNNPVNGKEHIAGIPFLHFFTVNVKMKR